MKQYISSEKFPQNENNKVYIVAKNRKDVWMLKILILVPIVCPDKVQL